MVKKSSVAVLMATYNGMAWLPEQVESILSQVDVDVKLIVSDDVSSDGSRAWLENLAKSDERVKLLPEKPKSGSAGKNFYRLIKDADIEYCDFISFADQDDIWLIDKLIRQIKQITTYSADGVSSNVVAFWADGTRYLVNKASLLRKYDYLFESAGPGCSFTITTSLFGKLKLFLEISNPSELPDLHDWFIYAFCRGCGGQWHIDERPLLSYRQHESNVIGVAYGIKAKLKRLSHVKKGWYHHEVKKICRIVQTVTTDRQVFNICGHLIQLNLLDRFRFLLIAHQLRRSHVERIYLALMIASFIF
mgnify:CR=1 FL=1